MFLRLLLYGRNDKCLTGQYIIGNNSQLSTVNCLRLLRVHFPEYQSWVYPAAAVLQSQVQVRPTRAAGHPNAGNSRTRGHSLTLPNLQGTFAIGIITPAVSR